MSLLFFGCPDGAAIGSCPPTPVATCMPLQLENQDTSGFILQLHPGENIQDILQDSCRRKFMIFELETFLFGLDPGSIESLSVRRECNCDYVLVDIEFADGVDLNNSGTASASAPKKQDDGSGGVIAAVDRNYNLNFGPEGGMPPISIPPAYYGIDEEIVPIRVSQGNGAAGEVVAAIIDSGVDHLHQNIGAKAISGNSQSVVWYNKGEVQPTQGMVDYTAFNTLNDDGNCLVDDLIGYDYFDVDPQPTDKNGHGTHIADVIGSSVAIKNVLPRLMPLKIGGYPNGGTDFAVDLFAALCALEYAIENDAQVINMSWGFYADEANLHLDRMIARAVAQDIVMVASVGNDGISVDDCTHWPSNYSVIHPDHVISVGAISQLQTGIDPLPNGYTKATYSNYGRKVDIFAPGTNISAAKAGTALNISLNGTSMAASVVTRQAVVLLATGTSPSSVKQSILQTPLSIVHVCHAGKVFDYLPDSTLNGMIR